MTAPRNAHLDGSRRFYTWRNEKYWSVTTILQAVPKYALLPWAVKIVAEGACDLADELPALVAKDRDAAVKMLKSLPDAQRDRAADLGTAVHEASEAYVLGKPFPDYSEDVAPRMVQFERFLADYRPTFTATEASVFNRNERYAGTLDAIARIGRRRVLWDVKSGKNVYPESALQLSAYRFAEFIGLPDGSQKAMPPVDFCAVLHLTDEGYSFREVVADDHIWKAFLYVRECFRWANETSKHVLLNEVKKPRARARTGEEVAA